MSWARPGWQCRGLYHLRLPRMPKDKIKVIMRPRGVMNQARVDHVVLARAIIMVAALTEQQAEEDAMCPNKVQNILIISTQHQSNAAAYAEVLKIHTSTRVHEVATHMAPPDKTSKGVIKNVDRSLDEATLHKAKGIKNTRVVAIPFEGLRVLSNVECGTAIVLCSLYKRQIDVCRACEGIRQSRLLPPHQ
ncbi:hypothetical protein HPB52_023368 [Rhipicephalus sanguineus]|uniref:Uncharacterized protein n=1 Tax=Rhipicephalus sanguineus TaxID=34632 RepID=A0A9D4QFU8_RHISA|nr:hypothetical protein HPB52_023368 [Rhipicephalus sanguineus]